MRGFVYLSGDACREATDSVTDLSHTFHGFFVAGKLSAMSDQSKALQAVCSYIATVTNEVLLNRLRRMH